MMLQRIPRPVRIVGNAILLFFAIVGGVSALAQLPTMWQPGDARSIIVQTEDTVLVSQGVFAPLVSFQGSAVTGDQLVESVIWLWRDGGAPISEEMIRRPLEFRMPPGSRAAAAKIVEVDSIIPDNFTVEVAPDVVTVRWKVFDPDMAVKIAIARFGTNEKIIESQNLGPGVVTTRSRYNLPKTVYYWGIVSIAFASVFASLYFLTDGGGMNRFAITADKLMETWPKALQLFVAVVTLILVVLAVAVLIFGIALLATLLVSAVVPPVPFT